NREVPMHFADRRECVLYTADNLEELLTYYLEHEEERRAIAEAAKARASDFSFESLWEQHLHLIDDGWPSLMERAAARSSNKEPPDVVTRTWCALGSSIGADATLMSDLAQSLVSNPQSAVVHNALGVIGSMQGNRG